jgi:5-methylcytosine-specific restriction endonuclease McrA
MLGKDFAPVPKPQHKRRTPKRVDRGKFSIKTIREILERDDYQCVRCGSRYLEAVPHHITYKSQGGLGTKDNGVTICLDCHKEAHTTREVREWFEKWRERTLDKNGDYL